MGLFNKKELKRIEELENEISQLNEVIQKTGALEYLEVQKLIRESKENASKTEIELQNKLDDLSKKIDIQQDKYDQKHTEYLQMKEQLFDITDEVNMQEFGLYKPKYDCMNSEEYSEKIKEIRNKQKSMIKNKTALDYFDNWQLEGSLSKGRAMNNDNMKMVLRAFNNECDSIIDKVKFNNIDKISKQINKSADAINKLNTRNRISITYEYRSLKQQELELVHEFRQKKQEEKEAIKEAREQERELAKLQKEIEEQKKKITKEQNHYLNAKETYLKQLENASEDEKVQLETKINEINNQLDEINKNLQEIDYREVNQRAGYVYVISNIGAFGENVYKIGMTRRLNPQDRVDELSDASVPFAFDVHAMIFSNDAPTLETSLHKAFEDKRVNMVNSRKEFFNVTLEEIEEEIKKNHTELIEINKTADAEQYRETLLIKKGKE